MNKLLIYGIISVCILSGAFAQVLFKMGLSNMEGKINVFTPEGFLRALFTKYILVGAVLYALAFFLWLLALSKLDLSLIYPLLSLGYIVTTFLSAVVLGERVNPSRWIGVVLIVIGVALVGLNR
ncbi:SMR family transporter [Thermococcus peptonophilus]|uniref:EamA domain-containing protein n=1 Tax=Thermococcus peptonophilus TaxID=53952 RepID=A0A142CXE8_9EURY|nr:SMR family transporter [Thermococcus peptonophilus]AMQ19450.1 hypothetical protein A0127_09890 [Thermococcus peptonophilus]